MTNEQAIAHFKEQFEVFGGEHHEAMKVAIEALEKMNPKKPNWIYEDEPMCPNCGEIMDDGENPCECCNQLIDWSE